MSEQVKAALIIGAALLVGVSLWLYFSPYQTCLRAYYSDRAALIAATEGTDLSVESNLDVKEQRREAYRLAALQCAHELGRR